MAGNEAIIQEFYNNDDHRSLLLHNVQATGNFIASGCGTFGKIEKVKRLSCFAVYILVILVSCPAIRVSLDL